MPAGQWPVGSENEIVAREIEHGAQKVHKFVQICAKRLIIMRKTFTHMCSRLLKELCHGDFSGLLLHLELSTFVVHKMLIARTLREDIKEIFKEKINHKQSFNECTKTEAINLNKLASFFQNASHFHPGQFQPKTLMFSFRALVE